MGRFKFPRSSNSIVCSLSVRTDSAWPGVISTRRELEMIPCSDSSFPKCISCLLSRWHGRCKHGEILPIDWDCFDGRLDCGWWPTSLQRMRLWVISQLIMEAKWQTFLDRTRSELGHRIEWLWAIVDEKFFGALIWISDVFSIKTVLVRSSYELQTSILDGRIFQCNPESDSRRRIGDQVGSVLVTSDLTSHSGVLVDVHALGDLRGKS